MLSITKSNLIQGIIPRIIPSGYHLAMKAYADWRVGALPEEARNSDFRIVLTFDDFGTTAQVNRLLSILDAQCVRGVFFVQGDWAIKHPRQLAKIEKAGHIIGNHTYSHPDLLSLSNDQIRAEISRGVTSPWVRPPRGRYNDRVRRVANEMGRAIKYWSIDSDDWQGTSAEVMSRNILGQLHPSRKCDTAHLHWLVSEPHLPKEAPKTPNS